MSSKRIIDSQLLLALLNSKDIFHNKAKEIVEWESGVIVLQSVRKEAKETFLRRYNSACRKIYNLVNDIRLRDFTTKEEVIEFARRRLDDIIANNRHLENFLRYVFDLIKDMW